MLCKHSLLTRISTLHVLNEGLLLILNVTLLTGRLWNVPWALFRHGNRSIAQNAAQIKSFNGPNQYINIGMLPLDFHNYLQDFQLSKHTQIKAFILKKLSVQSSTHDTHHDSNDIGTWPRQYSIWRELHNCHIVLTEWPL